VDVNIATLVFKNCLICTYKLEMFAVFANDSSMRIRIDFL